MARITKKTIRYYDEHNILKPSFVSNSGARFYSDDDFARLQQILFLKYLGFSLDEIKEITIRNSDKHFMAESLNMQLGLIEEKMEQMELIKNAIKDASYSVESGEEVDWSKMLSLVNSNEMEQRLKNQYRNASNIMARINLHSEFAINKKGWFPWVYEHCSALFVDNSHILELGCGDASLWENQLGKLKNVKICLTDISDGMVRDAKKNIGEDERFRCEVMDAHHINAKDETFDLVIANHVLFYCEDTDKVCREIHRVLKPGGSFICSTYGARHMKEISDLVKMFDERIVLSADKLYEKFGKENGEALLKKYFNNVQWIEYEDHLEVDKAEALIAYILSCHGNQNRYIVDRYKEFRSFVKNKTKSGFYVTKEAGIFVTSKQN